MINAIKAIFQLVGEATRFIGPNASAGCQGVGWGYLLLGEWFR